MLPSGPVVIPLGPEAPEPSANSVIDPPVVIRAILPAADSVNHRFPSGPGVIHHGVDPAVGMLNWLRPTPAGPTRSIWLVPVSVTHRLPSEPTTTSSGRVPLPSANVLTLDDPPGTTSPSALRP